MPRVMMVSLMPVLLHGESGDLHRTSNDPDRSYLRKRFANVTGHSGHKIGRGHDRREAEESR